MNVVLLRALNASSAVQSLLTVQAVTQKFNFTYFRDLWDTWTDTRPFNNHRASKVDWFPQCNDKNGLA